VSCAGSEYPGPIENATGTCEANVTRLLMGTRMAGAGVARQFRCPGTEAAEREGENENSARCPDHRNGSRRSRLALGRNGPCMLGDVRCLPMSFHRADPLIGNFDSRACRVSKRKNYTIIRLEMRYLDKFARQFSHGDSISSAVRTQTCLLAFYNADGRRAFPQKPGHATATITSGSLQ